MQEITIVGGGLSGLTAAIACAEQGAPVRLLEAHDELGGRARSTDGPYKANLGPHALLASSPLWSWLGERGLIPPYARPPLSGVRFRWKDDIRRVPAVGATVAALRLRGRAAPVDQDFGSWAAEASAKRRPTRCRAAPGSSPITTTPASCRLHSCGRRSSAGCCRRRPRRDSRSEGGRGSSISSAPVRSRSA